MKISSTLFSTVSLIVLFGALSSQLNAMQEPGTKEEGSTTTTVPVKTSDDVKKETPHDFVSTKEDLEGKVKNLLETDTAVLKKKLEEHPTPEETALTSSVIEYKEERANSNPIQNGKKTTEEDVQKVLEKVQKTTWAQSLGNAAWWLTLPVSAPLTGIYHLGGYIFGKGTNTHASQKETDEKDVVIIRKDDEDSKILMTETLVQDPKKEVEPTDLTQDNSTSKILTSVLESDLQREENLDLKKEETITETNLPQEEIKQNSPKDDLQDHDTNPFVESQGTTKIVFENPQKKEEELDSKKEIRDGNVSIAEKSSDANILKSDFTSKTKTQKKNERKKITKQKLKKQEEENRKLREEVNLLNAKTN
ncbi:hypothetical protein Bealeia1_01071 [Candidatus Bealeia paramacronuclearis]|uniref:Uncharacterized protein n=1 Tax=Candidatus Bealeia paramacronuclearis TaxID=1921001 RepID=A0ABZ2C361_9PROT|nr:hypothetical protein [Candidatus Bealeia paramacronuclearis]